MTRDDDMLMRGADVQSPAGRKQRERWRKNNNILPSGPVDLEPRTRDLYLRIFRQERNWPTLVPSDCGT